MLVVAVLADLETLTAPVISPQPGGALQVELVVVVHVNGSHSLFIANRDSQCLLSSQCGDKDRAQQVAIPRA